MVRVSDGSGAGVANARVRWAATSRGRAVVQDDSVAVSDPAGLALLSPRVGSVGDTATVTIWLGDGSGVPVRGFAVADSGPTIVAVSPAQARGGDTLTIRGRRLGGARSVQIGADRVTVLGTPVDSIVRAVAPACGEAGAAQVSLRTAHGAESNVSAISVVSSPSRLRLAPLESATIPVRGNGSCLQLDGGAGATYLVAAQLATDALAADPIAVELGARPESQAQVGAAMPALSAGPRGPDAARTFEQWLRTTESALAASAANGAPAMARRGASRADFSADQAGTAGDTLRTFSVVAALDGSRFETVTGRLAFRGQRLLVYEDVSTLGALSAGQRDALARLTNNDLIPAVANAFGALPDIDRNGQVILLLTPVINRMIRAADCVQRGFVTAFFYAPDLLERSRGTNAGEILYSFVPDPAGLHSCAHSEADMMRLVQPALMHELQHMISFHRRVLVRGGEPEATWLNEGLSQVAEELGSLVFEARFPPPTGRSTATQIFPDSAGPFIAPQLLNAYVYLTFALRHSVTAYEGRGSLEDRGASWLFLRRLVDRHGDALLRRLVESPQRGRGAIERETGARFGELFGEFSLSLFADSLPGLPRSVVPSALRFGTRNVRQLMARQATIAGFSEPFPLVTYRLDPGGSLRTALHPGTMMHAILQAPPSGAPIALQFTAPGGTALPPNAMAQLSVLRLPP